LESRSDVIHTDYDATVAGGVLLMPLPTLLRNVTLWADRFCKDGPKPTIRWLPKGLSQPMSSPGLAADQQGSLVTMFETQALIHDALITGTWGKDQGTALGTTDDTSEVETVVAAPQESGPPIGSPNRLAANDSPAALP
jgi:hypothetical protein